MSDVLTIRGLTVDYPVRSGLLTSRKHRAVTDVDLTISAGQTVALVGESGSGKTSVARAIVGLAPISAGSIALSDQLLDRRGSRRLRQIRRTVQMVFQQPGGSLDPRMSVADTLEEPLHYLMHLNSRAIRARVSELLGLVGLGQQHLTRRPRELSGGQRQRVAIARAIAISPSLVICDEPTSSLDVSVQAQIINLLSRRISPPHVWPRWMSSRPSPDATIGCGPIATVWRMALRRPGSISVRRRPRSSR